MLDTSLLRQSDFHVAVSHDIFWHWGWSLCRLEDVVSTFWRLHRCAGSTRGMAWEARFSMLEDATKA